MSGIAIGLFFLLGLVLTLVGYIWGLVQAFGYETLWGVLYLLVPGAAFVFYIKNWSNTKIRKTFLIQCAGLLMFVLAGITIAIFAPPSVPNVQPGFSEQSPSSFPSDFNTSPSPSSTPKPSP